jgi:hypothetical protein
MGIINFACVFSGDDMLESMTGYSKIEIGMEQNFSALRLFPRIPLS